MGNKFSLSDLESKKKKGLIKDYDLIKKGRDEKKKSKYGNKKTELDGHLFDSVKEANRYIQLRYLEKAGEIRDLRLQVEFKLSVCKYIADFTWIDCKTGEYIVSDVKGFKTATYRMKKKLMKAELGIEINEL